MKAALPTNEAERLRSLHSYEILDTASEQNFDDITLLASHICGTPIALISLVDADRQWFKSKVGITESETSRDVAFCAHGILQPDFLEVENALLDERFSDNPLITGPSRFRFYAGAPLVTSDGHALGMLCVFDLVSRVLSPAQKAALQALSRQVVALMKLRNSVKESRRLLEAGKKAEEVLAQKQTELRLLFDYIPAIVCFKDTNNRILRANQRQADALGKSVSELEGRSTAEIYPEEAAKFYADDLEVIRSGLPKIGIVEMFRNQKNEEVWIQTDKVPVRDQKGVVIGIIAMAIDISERKRATDALLESKRFLRSTLDALSSHIAILDEDGRIIEVNAAWKRFGDENGFVGSHGVGANYLHVCQSAAGSFADEASEVATGISAVMAGKVDEFHLEYPCHGPQEQRWFVVKATRFGGEGPVRLVVAHANITERKLAEAAMQRQQTEMRVLFDLIPAFIWFKDTKNNFLRVNSHSAKAAGKRVEDIEGKPCRDIYPLEADRFYADDLEVIRSGKPKLGIIEPLTAENGRKTWIQTDKVPYRGPDGEIVGIVVMAQDITDKKQMEESAAQLTAIVQSSDDAIIGKNLDGMVTSWNAGAEKMFGYLAQEILGQSITRLIPPHRLHEENEILARIRRGEITQHFDTVWLRRDGTAISVSLTTSAIKDPDGNIVGASKVARDITEREKRDESFRLLSSAVENCTESIVITDARLEFPGPRIIFVNPAFTAMTGYTPAEVFGQTTAIQHGPLTDVAALSRMARRIASGRTSQGQTVSYRKDGSTFDLEWHVAPIRNANNTITHFIGIQRNMSVRNAVERDLRRAREVALESSRLKSRFLANMSHELRTPLNTINGISATLIEQDLPPRAKESVTLILQCGESLLENIQTILTHSTLDAGKVTLENKPFSISEVVISALRITEPAAQKKNLALDYSLDWLTPTLMVGDQFRLQRILVNLLANAIKFTEKGQVYLRMRGRENLHGKWLISFSIADTGIGIAPQSIGKLFKPFSQEDDSTTRRFEGTGLGLAITKSLVDLMGGNIGVKSRPGVGSIFSFTIALPGVDQSPSVLASTARPEFVGTRLLIVEPHVIRQRALLKIAKAWQFDAEVVAHLDSSSKNAGEYDLVIRGLSRRESPGQIRVKPAADKTTTAPVLWLLPRGSSIPPTESEGSSTVLHEPFLAQELSNALILLLTTRSKRPAATAKAAIGTVKLGERLPLNILSADDIHTNRYVLSVMCEHLGYHTDLVENGAEVLESVAAHSYDLLLLDIQMPVMDGLSAARELCRRYPDPKSRPKIVAVTASVQPGDREKCLEAGMDDYLSKPLLPKHLSACIERLFGDSAKPVAIAPSVPVRPGNFIDHEHLRAVTDGLSASEAADLVVALHDTVKKDYAAVRPLLAEACASRETEKLIHCIHGLKGCVLSMGWARMGQRCAEVLSALRENRFEEWTRVPKEIDDLFEASSAELHQALLSTFGSKISVS